MFIMSEDEILNKFISSKIFKEKDRSKQTQLALFIALPEPDGLHSTFLGIEFTKLYQYFITEFNL